MYVSDLPILASGDKVGIFDPQEEIWQGYPGRMFELTELRSSSITSALHKIAKFDKDSPNYPHTIFRLPLRDKPSKLSRITYSVGKVKELLNALRLEAKYLLLFLKSVTKIEVIYVSEVKHSIKHKQTLCISIESENLSQVTSERSYLLEQLHSLHTCRVSRIIPSTVTFKINVTDRLKGQSETSEWGVVTQVGSTNEEVLQTAEELHIFPWVGTAVELSSAQTNNGRVFCFLPLPPEVTSNLPIHVNAAFSVNDERRALKWTETERANDILARWNDLLISSLLPDCYYKLLLLLRDKYDPEPFYQAWPDPLKLQESHWLGLLQDLYQKLFAKECVWSAESKCWVSIRNPVFIKQGDQLSSVITRVLTKCLHIVVQVPDIVWKVFDYNGEKVKIITPSLTRKALRPKEATYKLESTEDKLKLLQFCLSDKLFSNLSNIALIPLANGEFVRFSSESKLALASEIYVCSRENLRALIPNQDERLIDVSDNILQHMLIEVAESEETQLRTLNAERVAALLLCSFPNEWKDQSTIKLPCPGFPTKWFKIFWNWVQPYDLSHFIGLPVLPVATKSIRDGFKVTKLLRAHKSSTLVVPKGSPEDILTALGKLNVNCTMTEYTPYVKHSELSSYVNKLKHPSEILTAISNATSNPSEVNFSEEEAMCLQEFLVGSRILALNPSQKTVLENLSIFKTLNNSQLISVRTANSISWKNEATLEPKKYQLSASLPNKLVIFSRSENYSHLFSHFDIYHPSSMFELIETKVFGMIKAAKFPSSKMDALMTEILELLPVLRMQSSRQLRSISQLPFLPTISRQRKAPADLLDPSNKRLQNIFQGEDVFPLSPFNEEKYIRLLRKCGLQTEVSAQQLFDILISISPKTPDHLVKVSEQDFLRVVAVMDYISSFPNLPSQTVIFGTKHLHLDKAIQALASTRYCLPVLKKPPSDYPDALSWKGACKEPCLVALQSNVVCCTNERLTEVSYLVGSEAYIVHIPDRLSLTFSTELNMSMVLTHFSRVLDVLGTKELDKTFKPLVYQVYSFLTDNLEQCLQAKESNKFLCNKEWIWLSKKQKLIRPQFLALQEYEPNFGNQLEPYLYVLPGELQEYNSLFHSFGAEQTFSSSQIISVLNAIKNLSHKTVSPKRQWSVVTKILEWITDGGKTSASSKLPPSSILYVPITTDPDTPNPVLENVKDVVYTDLSYLKSFHIAKNKDCKFIHERVSHLAEALGAKGLSKELNISRDTFGDVGPHESLVTRLKNILKDYQDGLTIIKELIQNADDAEATEVNILYDARSHQTDPSTLLYPGMAKCHGPALVVHNNGVFSDDDFGNIEKLAGATKSGKHLKIGKFGLGFCSVYHLTDIPSFVSRERLYIFDPTLEYLKEENQDRSRPGKRLHILEKIVSHSKQLDPYISLFGFKKGQSYNGTMFRFPFRRKSSELSTIKYSDSHVGQLMLDVKLVGSKLLLFLQHVTRITFSQINQGQKKPTVLMDICKENTKSLEYFGDSLPETFTAAKLLSIKITRKSTTERESWLVATYSSAKVMFSGGDKYGVSSVACSIQKKGTNRAPISIEGEMFCFLPLSIRTGLPVHVSSNFAVKSDRSGIHASDEQQQSNEASWNTALIQSVVPQAYCLLLQALQGMCEDKTIAASDYEFTSLWPLREDLRIRNPWVEMVRPTYELIMNKKLFYSSNRETWLMFSEIKVLSQSILCLAHRRCLPACAVKVMESLKYKLVSLPLAYQELLPTNDNAYIINEEEFLGVFFENFKKLGVSTRNEVLHLLLLKFAEVTEFPNEGDYAYLKSYLTDYRCIPCRPDGENVRFCSDVVNPNAYFAALYDCKDEVFPVHSDNELAHIAMKKLGMLSESLPWSMIIERARSIESLYKKNKEKAMQRVIIILKCISNNVAKSSGELPPDGSELTKISFLPVMTPPKSYPDFLFWQGKSKTLLSCQEALCGENNHRLAGSQKSIICEKPPSKGGCGVVPHNAHLALSIRSLPTLCAAVNHLCHVAEEYTKLTLKSPKKLQVAYKWINESTAKIFDFFETELLENKAKADDFKKLQENKCIWSGSEFVSPKSIAIKWEKNGPFLFKLPDILKSKKKLIKALNIQKRFTVDQLLAALKDLYDFNELNPIREKSGEMKLIKAIVSELDEIIPESGLDAEQTCYLPDENCVMRKVDVLAFNDAPWCKVDSEYHMAHRSISRHEVQKLGVKLIRAKALESYESPEQHFEGVEFGQHEELTQRIKNILDEYPFDITVIKELLQNADDAKAKKLYFILDKRKHKNYQIPSDGWKDLQGPAVLVWNDAGFSKEDLSGIQRLGLGSKRPKSEAIGQYGIGFNVVYHLTDCPSFITNGNTFCVLDPHMHHVPGATERRPGRMFVNLDDNFWNNWSDLKGPYLRQDLPGCPQEVVTSGSLFRLPLRHKLELVKKSMLLSDDGREAASISDYPLLTADRMERHLDDWAPKMKDALIFLNSVVELKFFVIKKNSEINLKFHFTARLEEEALSKRLTIQHKAEGFIENRTPTSEFYTLSLSEEVPLKCSEKWLVKRGIGDSMKPDQNWEFLQYNIIPSHGLATPVGRKEFQGNVFCFLPLPMYSYLPVHVNGSFILDAARSGLWKARDFKKEDDKTRWNNCIMEAIASSYSEFVVKCQNFYVQNCYSERAEIDDNCQSYYRVFPYSLTGKPHGHRTRTHSQSTKSRSSRKKLPEKTLQEEGSEFQGSSSMIQDLGSTQGTESAKSDTPAGQMYKLAELTYLKLVEKNAEVHIVVKEVESATTEGDKGQSAFCTEWHPLTNEKEMSKQVYFWFPKPKEIKITSVLKRIGLHLSAAPIWIRRNFHRIGHELPEITPTSVFEFYKNYFAQVAHIAKLPCAIEKTSFHTVEDFKLFTEYILLEKETSLVFPGDSWDLPLLVTADNQLTFFKKKEKVIHTAKDYSDLFKDSLGYFLHSLLLDIKYNKSYFMAPSDTDFIVIQRILYSAIPQTIHKVHFVSEVPKSFNISLLWDCLTSEVVFRTHLEKILKEWALLASTDGQSFSCTTSDQLLPVIPPQKEIVSYTFSINEIDPLAYEVYELLSEHNMPVLDISICNVMRCKKFCPEFPEPKAILNNMYHHYKLFGCGTLYTRDVLDNNVKKLYRYLAKIHFSQDETSLTRVKALPLFCDISGCYKSLENKACIWPGLACMAGSEKWLNEHATVFLPAEGDWHRLARAEVLRIVRISSLELYTKFIFPSFGKFSHNERIAHLKHVRDIKELFDTAYAMSENEQLHSKEADLFVGALKQLPCLPIDEVLKPLHEFCDPESNIFKLFPEDIHFPTKDFSDKKWLEFFHKIGMRTDPTPEEFLLFCTKIANGKHAKILEASKALVEHLCFSEEWHNNEKFLRKVSNIEFACAHKVPKVAWIKAPCPAANTVEQGKKSFSLTALRGSVVHSARNSKIIWTVRCLVELPQFHHTASKERIAGETSNFLKSIGVSLDPSPEEVTTNLLNISQTVFADFALFREYKNKLVAKKDDFPLVEVVHEHFLYLRNSDELSDLLSRLRDVPCIPVSHKAETADIVRPVLVKPVGVVATYSENLQDFVPFLNPLPDLFSNVITQLTEVGVSRSVQLEQVQFGLDTIKELCIEDPCNDPNTFAVLKELLKQLYLLLPNKASNRQISKLKCPLYLPNTSSVLVDSRTLLFNDLGFHRDASLNLHNVKFSFMSLLVRREEEQNEYNFTADDLYKKLPEHVQPQSLSKSCMVELHEACKPITDQEEQSELVVKLRKAFKFQQFAEVVYKVIKHEGQNEEDSRQFSDDLDLFLKGLQVITVKGLKVNIFLPLADPPTKIGAASTDFHFQKEARSPEYILYIEEAVPPLRFFYLLEKISEQISQCVQMMSSCAFKGAEKIICVLMRAEDVEQIQEYLREFRINTSDLQLEESVDFSHKPKVGERIPKSWHHRLQCDINNCFRPQQLAALEVGEEQYIYVVVEYKLTQVTEESDSEEDEGFELDKYQIIDSESENDIKSANIVELFKLLSIKEVKHSDDTLEMVLYDSESEMSDSAKEETLKDIMKDICSDLRQIWKIKNKDNKRKATKALYLKWHPDKNSHCLATKAFQFLQQQIVRLEEGLPLDDPREDWEQDNFHWWSSSYDFRWWDEIVRERKRTWWQERKHYQSSGGGVPTTASDWTHSVDSEPDKAKVWFEQAQYDQQTMKIILKAVSCEVSPKPKLSAQVCFLACQVAEKSIIAGMYQVWGLQSERLKNHKFVGYAGALEQKRRSQACGLQRLAKSLEDYYVKTRYPNAFSPHEAPSNRFGPSDAQRADIAASQIFEIIRKVILSNSIEQ